MVRNKILAVILGPEGVGLFAQLQNVQNLAANAVPMGMQVGATRYFARVRALEPELLPSYIKTYARTLILLSIITVVFCLIFIKQLASWALSDINLFFYLIPAVLGVPFLIQSQVWFTYLQASLETKAYSKALVATAIAGFIIAVPLVYFWKQTGAAIHLLIFAAIGYLITRFYAISKMSPELKIEIRKSRFDSSLLVKLTRFGVANIPSFAFYLLIPFIVRTKIIADLGLAANGIFQAAYAICNQQMAVLLNALTIHTIPKLSQLTNVNEINSEVNKNLKVALLINTPVILFALLTSDFLVNLLFSKDFSAATKLFPLILAGHYFRSISYALAGPMLPMERFRARNIQCVAQYAVFLIIFYSVKPQMRLYGAAAAEVGLWSFCAITTYFYFKWLNNFYIENGNWRPLIASTMAIGITAFIPMESIPWRLAGFGISIIWAVTALSPKEYAKLRETLRNKIASKSDQPSNEEYTSM